MSPAHARHVRRTLEAEGVQRIGVVLSHRHTDHIAGAAVFEDCEIIANELTLQAIVARRAALAAAMPPVDPVIMPNHIFTDRMSLQVGRIPIELRRLDIHSQDGTVVPLPDRVLLAGDTVEDSVTFPIWRAWQHGRSKRSCPTTAILSASRQAATAPD